MTDRALRSGLLVPSPQSPSALAGWGNHVSPSLPWFGRSLPVLDSPHRCFAGTFFFFKSCLQTELRCGPRSDRKSGVRKRPFLAQVTPAVGGDTLSRGVKAQHQPAHSSRCWFLPRQPQGTPPRLVWPQGAWRCAASALPARPCPGSTLEPGAAGGRQHGLTSEREDAFSLNISSKGKSGSCARRAAAPTS